MIRMFASCTRALVAVTLTVFSGQLSADDALPPPGPGQSVVILETASMGDALNPIEPFFDEATPFTNEHVYTFTLPAENDDYINLSFRLNWPHAAEYLTFSVQRPSGASEDSTIFVDATAQTLVMNNVTSGEYTVTVKEHMSAGTASGSEFTLMGTVLRPAEEVSECQAAYGGVKIGAETASVDPAMPFGTVGSLILSFADPKSRDAAVRRLQVSSNLPVNVAAAVYGFKHLNAVVVPDVLISQAVVEGLRQSVSGLSLISIWGDHAQRSLLETSVPLIGVNAAREAFAGPTYSVTGAGVGVAILDTGVDASHNDLERVIHNVRMIDNNAVEMENSEATLNGHGTHIASTIAGDGADSGGAKLGVAPGADVVGVGVDVGSYVFVLNGMDYVLDVKDEYNIRLSNHSYGPATGSGFRFDPASSSAQALKRLYDAGITAVFAAGNNGPDNDTISADAQNPCVLGVGAGDRQYGLTGFSSRGTPDGVAAGPDIVAPGNNISAARALTGVASTGVPDADAPTYSTISGTSMAAPHVVGVLALLLEADPSLTFEEQRALIQSTARQMPGFSEHEVGAGYIDAAAAIAELLGEDRPDEKSPFTDPGPGETEVANFDGSYGVYTTSVLCGGCPSSDSDGGFGTYLFRYPLPADRLYDAIEFELIWREETGPVEQYQLTVEDPAGATHSAQVGIDIAPDGLGSPPSAVPPSDGSNSLLVRLDDPQGGEYEIFVKGLLNAGFAPFDVVVRTYCPESGCVSLVSNDSDSDGVNDDVDNCPAVSNADQTNTDKDFIGGDDQGDACDNDDDADGVDDGSDAFPLDPTESADSDSDSVGDNADNCPTTANADQADLDTDGAGDVCDSDIDGDGIANEADECPHDASNSCVSEEQIKAVLSSDTTGGAYDLVVNFDASGSSYADDTAIQGARYTFVFGDGTDPVVQDTATISHTYTAAGTYKAYVVVTDENGEYGISEVITIRTTVSVDVDNPQPTVAALKADVTSGSAPLQVTFDGSQSVAAQDTSIVQWVFKFGDGNSRTVTTASAAAAVVYTYTTPGTFRPSLTVTDSVGGTDTTEAAAVKVADAGGNVPEEVAPARSGGGSLGWLILLPLMGAALRRRQLH